MKYYDVHEDLDRGLTFNFIIGGRGIGKTFSALRSAVSLSGNFIYLRRSKTEIELCALPETNPFKAVNNFDGTDYKIQRAGDLSTILDPEGNVRGYAMALSTFGNLRGVDFSDVNLILFDEFVPQKNARPIKAEDEAFFNLYETVNRNRELDGLPPVRVLMLSNAVSINSPILAALGLVGILERMIAKGKEYYIDRDRSILVRLPYDADFAAEKSMTALYRLTAGSRYADHAIGNKFAYDSWYNVRSRPLGEYTPVCSYDDLYIYAHKSRREYYVCRSAADCPHYNSQDTQLNFRKNHGIRFRDAAISGKMVFSDFAAKAVMYEVLKLET